MLPTFGAKWLIPLLPQFQQREPQVTLHFVPYVDGYDFKSPTLDSSILFGDGHWPGARAHYLVGQQVALIAPPLGSPGAPAIRTPQDLIGCTRLRHVTIPDAWAQWSQAQGVSEMRALDGPQFDQFQSIIRAVMAGMGVALVPRCLVQDEIASGLVTEPLPGHGYTSHLGYWFCYPEGRAHHGALSSFRSWLLETAAQSSAAMVTASQASASDLPT